jgi:hypothetical protein
MRTRGKPSARWWAGPVLLLMAVAGCEHPIPTAIDHGAAGRQAASPGLLKMGTAFRCEGSIRAGEWDSPWRHGRATVRFAPDELAPDGSTLRYQFRGYEAGARLVGTAECIIPRTDAAIRRMDANFGVRTKRSPIAPALRISGPRLDCSGDSCSLPGLTVTVCTWGGIWPYCYSKPTSLAQIQCGALDPACSWGGGVPDDPWSWGGGGGTPPEGGCDPATDPECEKPLTNEDVDAIRAAIRSFVLPDSMIQDTPPDGSAGRCAAHSSERWPEARSSGGPTTPRRRTLITE